MMRRRFFQLLASAAITAAMKPWEGFGLGQEAITPEIPLSWESRWSRITQVTFPAATSNWGLITHVIIPGKPNIIIPIGQKYIQVGDCPRLTLFGDLQLEGTDIYARLYSGDEVALGRFTREDDVEEISAESYKRGQISEIQINTRTVWSFNPEI